MRLLLLLLAAAFLYLASTALAMSAPDAQALARAVNLTRADMPGYTASHTDASDTLSADRNFTRCSGMVPASKAVADVPSQTFERTTDAGYQSIYSELVVQDSAALVQKDLKALGTSRARKCIVKQLRKEGGKALVKITVTPLKPAVPNGTGLRLKSIVRTGRKKVPVYIDVLDVGHDDAEALIIFSGGPRAPQRSQEDDLLEIVESRLVAEQNKDTIF